MAQEEYRVITNKGIDVAEIDYDLQRDTSSDAGVDSDVFPDRTCDVSHAKATNNRITCYMLCLLYTSPSPRDRG